MAVDDFHFIAAKRAVADSLSKQRAWTLVQQRNQIDNLKLQLEERDKTEKTLMLDIESCEDRYTEAVDANMDIQQKLIKAKQWATIGKIGVCLVSFSVLAVGVTAIVR